MCGEEASRRDESCWFYTLFWIPCVPFRTCAPLRPSTRSLPSKLISELSNSESNSESNKTVNSSEPWTLLYCMQQWVHSVSLDALESKWSDVLEHITARALSGSRCKMKTRVRVCCCALQRWQPSTPSAHNYEPKLKKREELFCLSALSLERCARVQTKSEWKTHGECA